MNEKETILAQAEGLLGTFEKKVAPALQDASQNPQRTVYDIVTLASILEREVSDSKDRRIVAGILWKRIELGIPLQVDATIAFITGKKTGEITLADLQTPSPYNTYLHRGLPSGPIANPGLDAIESAAHPDPSDYLYYLSKPTGETVFSKTLEEHNIAKATHLKK